MGAGYRRRKMAICTRFEQEIGRKPGTGEEKWRSVPDLSGKSGGNRVQEKENGDLYPLEAGKRKKVRKGFEWLHMINKKHRSSLENGEYSYAGCRPRRLA